jgi:hypothetical protein
MQGVINFRVGSPDAWQLNRGFGVCLILRLTYHSTTCMWDKSFRRPKLGFHDAFLKNRKRAQLLLAPDSIVIRQMRNDEKYHDVLVLRSFRLLSTSTQSYAPHGDVELRVSHSWDISKQAPAAFGPSGPPCDDAKYALF